MVIADCVTFRNVFFSNWGLGILKGYSAEKVVAAVDAEKVVIHQRYR